MDITLKPTSFSGRGQMIEAELRYKTENSKTEIQLANMDKDDVKGKGRHAYLIRDIRNFRNDIELKNDGIWEGTSISSNIDIGGISDLTYFDDFGNSVSRVGSTHISREF